MFQDEPRDEEKDNPQPGADDLSAAGESETPGEESDRSSGEGKPAVRKKPADSREHREPRDQQKIKALRAEIEDLKKILERRSLELDNARDEIRTARSETAEWKDKMLRTLAETENLRKRLEREKSEYFQFALGEILKDVLHVIDNLERALKSHDAPEGFREGVELIWKQMSDLAAKRGVTPLPETDGKFDPAFHHALTTEEADGIEEPMIGEMLQQGYMLNDRLLRPALVKVLVPKRD